MEYDSAGLLTAMVYPSGARVEYGYPAAGAALHDRPSSLTLVTGGGAGGVGGTRTPLLTGIEWSAWARAEKQKPSYEEFCTRLLRAQWQRNQETSLAYRIKQARMPEQWSLETFPFKRQKGVDQRQIRTFAELDFIPKAENIVFMGGTGVGKTGLASGLLLKALQNGHRGVFMRAQDLFDEMYASLADRSTRKLLNRLVSVDVLLIDEMGYLNLKPEQTNIFFKLMEERYRRRPTIITTNLEYEAWGSFLGNKALVEALLSRLRHQCHTVKIDGPTLRDSTG